MCLYYDEVHPSDVLFSSNLGKFEGRSNAHQSGLNVVEDVVVEQRLLQTPKLSQILQLFVNRSNKNLISRYLATPF